MLTKLFRPELRSLKPYQAATYEDGLVRLNANETPFPGSEADGLNRYPAVRPETLSAMRHCWRKTGSIRRISRSHDSNQKASSSWLTEHLPPTGN